MMVGDILLLLGCLVSLAVVIGIFRMDDFFLSVHIAGVSDVLSSVCIVLGVIFAIGTPMFSLKLVCAVLLMLITASAGTSVLANVAYIAEDAHDMHHDQWVQ